MSVSTATPLPPASRDYLPRGGAVELLECRDPECLISGSAGTGKSCAVLYKLHLIAQLVPNFRGLLARKTRVSLTESGLVTFEKHVVQPQHPILDGPTRAHRTSYVYPNGSTLVVAGLDRPSRIMSSEYDICALQEATELTEEDWEMVTTRLRNNRLPWQQIIGDANPQGPQHWLKKRCDAKKCRLIESRHEDNPTVTPEYLAKLDALTGARYERLRWGRWVQSEGVIYSGWDARIHLLDRKAVNLQTDWRRYISIDFGFTAPAVVQWWAKDHDGRLYRYRELYQTGMLVEDMARKVKELSKGEPAPTAVICDHDREGRATFEKHSGWRTINANKKVLAGIEAVQSRLRPAKDGRPRIFFLRDSLVQRDPQLVEDHLPTCFEEEVDGYVWSDNTKKEEPVKENDHAQDCCRYVISHMDLKGVATSMPKRTFGGFQMPR